MAQFIKHVGRNMNGKKVVVVFREVPNESESALVIPTESLPSLFHDDLIKVVESHQAQASLDPSEFLFRQSFFDGTNMLNTIHQKGWMVKVPAKSIMMTPRPGVEINLVDLNRELQQIDRSHAAQHGATRSGDIANSASSAAGSPSALDDINLAAKFRSQAATFELEVKRLREEAEKLDPKGTSAGSQQSPSTEVKRGRGRPPKMQVVQ